MQDIKNVILMPEEACGTMHIFIEKKIHKLLDENREALLNGDVNNAICYDGVVCEKTYCRQKTKLMFLLKETNGDVNGKKPEKYEDWDYAKWIHKIATKKEKLYPTFRNIAMWSSEFFKIAYGGVPSKEKYFKNGALKITDELLENLDKISVVNLKKTWGRGSSNWTELNEYLDSPKVCEVLKEQIHQIDPDVVLCGGREVYDFVKKIYGVSQIEIDIVTEKGNKISYMRMGEKIFVYFNHPACRNSREKMFEYALDVFSALKDI